MVTLVVGLVGGWLLWWLAVVVVGYYGIVVLMVGSVIVKLVILFGMAAMVVDGSLEKRNQKENFLNAFITVKK